MFIFVILQEAEMCTYAFYFLEFYKKFLFFGVQIFDENLQNVLPFKILRI